MTLREMAGDALDAQLLQSCVQPTLITHVLGGAIREPRTSDKEESFHMPMTAKKKKAKKAPAKKKAKKAKKKRK